MTLKALVKRVLKGDKSAASAENSVEQPAAFYDDAYANVDEYKLDYPDSRYYFVWTVIVDRVRRLGAKRVLEIGCGPGQLARFLMDQGVESYVGLDFSATALDLARQNAPGATFVLDDARTSDVYRKQSYDLLICTEVLEHIQADLEVLSNFPRGVPCICSVPSFPYRSHVRHFRNCAEVASRYQPLLDKFTVYALSMPVNPENHYFLFDGIRNERQSNG